MWQGTPVSPNYKALPLIKAYYSNSNYYHYSNCYVSVLAKTISSYVFLTISTISSYVFLTLSYVFLTIQLLRTIRNAIYDQ